MLTSKTATVLSLACLALTISTRADAQSSTRLAAPETYARAVVDDTGALVITTTAGRSVRIQRNAEQAGFSKIKIAPDRTAVGALADYDNCCTSYPLARQLVVYAAGRLHRFRGAEMPIFWWAFAAGTRVAFGQTTAHFGCAIHYELHAIDSERLVSSIDVPEPCGQRPNPKAVREPKWVRDLRAAPQED
jgi:hypothetical protein